MLDCILVRVGHVFREAVVSDVAEQPVDAESETPSKDDLVVGVHAVVDAADCDRKDYRQSHGQCVHTGLSVRVVVSAEQVPHRQIERHGGQ